MPASSSLETLHGSLAFPAFLPDATHGFVRSVEAQDLELCQVPALMMNTFCLMQRPGATTLRALGGLHSFSGWNRPIVTDSGGFQLFSIIRENSKNGTISDRGAVFYPEQGRDKIILTPEKAIQRQFAFGSDVLFCLDECTHPDDPAEVQSQSVERTIAWAKESRRAFDHLADEKKLTAQERPKLFAIVQGGNSTALRRQCADALLEIGFDGYGFGGWPLDSKNQLLTDSLALTRELIPSQFPLHALGVGHPQSVATCVRLGYTMLDSTLPTKDARNGRVYCLKEAAPDLEETFFSFLYLLDEKHLKSDTPLSPFCKALCCQRYSRAYLHHLFSEKDPLAYRLATLHNLAFMMDLTGRLKQQSLAA